MPLYPSEPAGGGGTPGGSNTQLQYNNSSAFGGVANVTSNGTVLLTTAGTAAAPNIGVGVAGTGLYSVSTTGLGAAINGSVVFDYGIAFAGALTTLGNIIVQGSQGLTLTNNAGTYYLRNQNTAISSPATNTVQLGAAVGGAGSAQKLQGQFASATNSIAGNLSIVAGLSTGTGTNPDLLLRTGVKVGTGTTQATETTALTLKGETQSVIAAAALTSAGATGGIGYSTGAGGTVTQTTSKSTGVTLNTACGQITMNNASLAGQTEVSFTLTNSVIATTDVVVVSIVSGATANSYVVGIGATAAGSCVIQLGNVTLATTLSEAVVLNFAVIKGVTS